VKFLVDNALPQGLARLLKVAGYDAVHVRDYGIQHDTDELILMRASEEDRVIISADTDFAAILAAQDRTHPSFILFREAHLTSGRVRGTLTSRFACPRGGAEPGLRRRVPCWPHKGSKLAVLRFVSESY
jgi:predicted nuclease of predicted toxin-antitoxin system